jgi:ankyrin repeat protein
MAKNQDTLLHIACTSGKLEVVKLLIDNGADISAANLDGFTPLHIACSHGKLEVDNFLVGNGADISAVDDYGDTPLHFLNGKQRKEIEDYISTLNFLVKPAKR